jgi:hypothetical protein
LERPVVGAAIIAGFQTFGSLAERFIGKRCKQDTGGGDRKKEQQDERRQETGTHEVKTPHNFKLLYL